MLRETLLVLIFFSWAPMLSGQTDATKKEPDIYNFLRLNEKYCTGGQPRVEDLTKLKATGTRAIVNLRRPSEFDEAGEVAEARRLGLRYYNIPVNSRAPQDEQVEQFLEILRNPENLPVFIHCGSASRVGGFWMIRRVLVDGWSIEKAEALRVGMRSQTVKDFAHSYIARRYIERHIERQGN